MSPTDGPAARGPEGDDDAAFGLGLGFFIAKTLLERSGAKLSLINQSPPLHGATVTVTWSRADFERPIVSPPLEPAAKLLSCYVLGDAVSEICVDGAALP